MRRAVPTHKTSAMTLRRVKRAKSLGGGMLHYDALGRTEDQSSMYLRKKKKITHAVLPGSRTSDVVRLAACSGWLEIGMRGAGVSLLAPGVDLVPRSCLHSHINHTSSAVMPTPDHGTVASVHRSLSLTAARIRLSAFLNAAQRPQYQQIALGRKQ